MNKDNAKDFLPLVEALASGKTIQIKADDIIGWVDMPDVVFGSAASEYRIKPEPKKAWYRVALCANTFNGTRVIYTTTVESEVDELDVPDFIKWLTDRIEYVLPEEEG